MAVPSPINTTSAPRAPSPRWIIALFIALSEFMAGVAAIATSGTTQMVFAFFAVVFPALVLILFVWLLIKHPANLYSPGQYTTGTPIDAFAKALARENRDEASQLREAFTAVVAATAEPGLADADRMTAVAEILTDFSENSFVTVDRSALLPGAPPAVIPVTA